MANEIEFKVEITREQLLHFFSDRARNLKVHARAAYMKLDEYYEAGSKEKNEVIRIRGQYPLDSVSDFLGFPHLGEDDNEVRGEYYLCYKEKTIVDGSEVSNEYESRIEDPNVFRKIMASKNIPMYFTKRKKALKVVFRDEDDEMKEKYNIEFVIVNCRFYYIEIEWVSDFTDEYDTPDKVVKFLEEKIKLLGFDPSKKDSRTWKNIIESAEPLEVLVRRTQAADKEFESQLSS